MIIIAIFFYLESLTMLTDLTFSLVKISIGDKSTPEHGTMLIELLLNILTSCTLTNENSFNIDYDFIIIYQTAIYSVLKGVVGHYHILYLAIQPVQVQVKSSLVQNPVGVPGGEICIIQCCKYCNEYHMLGRS